MKRPKRVMCPRCGKVFIRGRFSKRMKCPYCKKYIYPREIQYAYNKYNIKVSLL